MSGIESGARYIITNVKGGTVVDLSGEDNVTVIGYPRHGGENQQWETIWVEGGWHFKNVRSGTYLTLEGQARDNVRVIATEEPFVWNLWDDEEDSSTIRVCVPNTRENLDLSDYGNSNPGTPVLIWGRWEGKNQTWRFERGKLVIYEPSP